MNKKPGLWWKNSYRFDMGLMFCTSGDTLDTSPSGFPSHWEMKSCLQEPPKTKQVKKNNCF